MTPFVAGERSRAARWKQTCPDLPEGARADAAFASDDKVIEGPFPFCLPVEFASHNLLPSARKQALAAFDRLAIPWHARLNGGPSNHLLDSQVQCANALAPHMADAGAVAALFGDVLPIADVLVIENGWFLTFEWIGRQDHLGEGWGQPRTRGALTTSVDAAIRYVAHDGAVEVALIEWKYTEDYGGRPLSGGPSVLEGRMERYRPFWDDPECPIDTSAIPYGELFREPLYQMFRQQLLADQMERTGELGAERVRVVVAVPSANAALAGDHQRWPKLLRHPDRFAVVHTESLLEASAPTHEEYRARYG